MLLLVSGCLLCACAPQFKLPDKVMDSSLLTDTLFMSFDGTELPLRTWLPSEPPRAVFIALHGFNDYSNFIKDAAAFFTTHGIAVYAYDQRGFGQASGHGRWFGQETMAKDLRTIIDLVRQHHPAIPLYLLGDSMGGAVMMVADHAENPLETDGMILVAPAVWSRNTMPFYQRWLLALASRTVPWLKLTAKKLNITPSDNEEMLKALGRDPLVIKETRVDAIYGLSNLMDAAYEAAARLDQKVLFLYGTKDEIIPVEPMADVFRQRLNGHFVNPQRLLVYPNGYHMLLRDLQAEVVLNDILFWLDFPHEPFPSVRQGTAHEIKKLKDITAFIYPGFRN